MTGGIDYEKMSVFEQVMQGLKEGVAHARGELTLKTTTLPAPAPKLTKKRVLAIRKKTGMSQSVFACYLNVPTRTLQSWEQGARTPKASEARLLQILDVAPQQILLLVSGVEKGGARRRPRSGRGRPKAAA